MVEKAEAVVVEIVKYYSLLLYSYCYSQIVAAVVVEDATKYMKAENISYMKEGEIPSFFRGEKIYNRDYRNITFMKYF